MADSKQIIALTDLEAQARYFTQEDLQNQLAAIDLAGAAPIKAAMRTLANAVEEMRQAQKDYFKSTYGSPEKQAALNRSKAAEAKVDKMLTGARQFLARV